MTVEQRLLAAVWARYIENYGLFVATHHLMQQSARSSSDPDELVALQTMLVAALKETSKDVATVFE